MWPDILWAGLSALQNGVLPRGVNEYRGFTPDGAQLHYMRLTVYNWDEYGNPVTQIIRTPGPHAKCGPGPW